MKLPADSGPADMSAWTRPCLGWKDEPAFTCPTFSSLLAALGWFSPPLMHAYVAVASAVSVYVISEVPRPASSMWTVSAPELATDALVSEKKCAPSLPRAANGENASAVIANGTASSNRRSSLVILSPFTDQLVLPCETRPARFPSGQTRGARV